MTRMQHTRRITRVQHTKSDSCAVSPLACSTWILLACSAGNIARMQPVACHMRFRRVWHDKNWRTHACSAHASVNLEISCIIKQIPQLHITLLRTTYNIVFKLILWFISCITVLKNIITRSCSSIAQASSSFNAYIIPIYNWSTSSCYLWFWNISVNSQNVYHMNVAFSLRWKGFMFFADYLGAVKHFRWTFLRVYTWRYTNISNLIIASNRKKIFREWR